MKTKRDKTKHLPLFAAVSNNNFNEVKKLIEQGASVYTQNLYGNTALHFSKATKADPSIETLLIDTGGEKLKNIKNIYGKTYLDYSDGLDVNKTIHQNNIRARMESYLKLKKRDLKLLDELGICSGLSFLFLFYSRQGKKDYFFQTLKMIADWDGELKTLQQQLPETSQQAKYYNNLEELFEQWINDVVSFQKGITAPKLESATIWPNQLKRDEQYNLLKPKEEKGNIQYIYQFDFKYTSNTEASKSKIRKLLEAFQTMPPGACFEIYGGKHVTNIQLDENHQFIYYDSSFIDEVPPIKDVNELLNYILDTKYTELEQSPSSQCGFFFQIYHFPQDANNFSKFDSLAFQKKLDAINNDPLLDTTYDEVADKLITLTEQYKKSLHQRGQTKEIIPIVDKALDELNNDINGVDKIKNFYRLLFENNNGNNPNCTNIDFIKSKDNSYSARRFLLGIITIAVITLTGILPGLITSAIVYKTTGRHVGDFFKTTGEQFKKELDLLKEDPSLSTIFSPKK